MPQSNQCFNIIIPVLNEEGTIGNLLEDLAIQTFKDFSVTIVDGKSTDNTIDEVKQHSHKFPSLNIITSDVQNVCYQRNLGANHSHSPWILFIDADTRVPPYFLKGIDYHIEELKPDVFGTYIAPDSTNRKDNMIAEVANRYLQIQQVCFESAIGFRRKVFIDLNGFDEELGWGEGGYIIEQAKSRGYSFSIFKDPKHIYSLRRLRKDGTLKTARVAAQLELARLLNIKVPKTLVSSMYPMQGGEYFSKYTHKNTIEYILNVASKIKKIPDTLQTNLRDSFKDYRE